MARDSEKDDAFDHMVDSLQFVTWKHLDLNCLTKVISQTGSSGSDEESNEFPIDETIWRPLLKSICSVDSHWSPTAKIQEMSVTLKLITNALESASKDGDSLPGADDILPLLILAIIKAKPQFLYSNLPFIQYYATPEKLRGEGGYVVTQFQSATHFIMEIDAASLTIDSTEFEKGLKKCREDLRRSKKVQMSPQDTEKNAQMKDESCLQVRGHCDDEKYDEEQIDIPISEIHSARKNGEVINLEWAMQSC